MWLRILLTAETPLSFRTGRNPSQSTTLPYVSGTSLVGCLAQAYQWLGGNHAEFAEFFLRDRIRFGNCYPADFKTDELSGEDQPVLQMPLTARSCKRFSGFKYNADREQELRAGVTDALVPLALFALSHETAPQILLPLETHPETGQPLERIDGFFRRGRTADQIGQPKVRLETRTRTGINFQTGTAQSSVLYSRQVIPAGTPFWGRWWIDDDLWETFQTFVDEANEGQLRLGNNRTRGFGRIQFSAEPLEEDRRGNEIGELGQRITAFTERLKAAAGKDVATPAALYVPILCVSDVILHDPLRRSRLQLGGEDLAAVGIPAAELVFHAASTAQVQSWSALWGLPKADDCAISKGSVFLFALQRNDQETFAKLLQLQDQGLGERKTEGFGMISVADRFHTELVWGQYR